jgi:hypothetical protein
MPSHDSALRCLIAVLLLSSILLSQTTPAPQRERFQNAEVIYGWAQDKRRTQVADVHHAP